MHAFTIARRLLLLCLLSAFAAGPLLAQDDDEFFVFDEEEDQVPPVADPLESFNRASFALNDKLYRGVLKPVARGLRVLPVGLRTSLANFFDNLGTPVSAISALLQADPKNAATELSRFVINTTVGIAGLLDPATDMGLVEDTEDLGQALGRFGVGHGFYLVIPLMGPSSLRDMIGSSATAAVNPLYWDLDSGEIIALNLTDAEIALSLDQDTYESFYDSALDPYIFFRSAWEQNRAGQVRE